MDASPATDPPQLPRSPVQRVRRLAPPPATPPQWHGCPRRRRKGSVNGAEHEHDGRPCRSSRGGGSSRAREHVDAAPRYAGGGPRNGYPHVAVRQCNKRQSLQPPITRARTSTRPAASTATSGGDEVSRLGGELWGLGARTLGPEGRTWTCPPPRRARSAMASSGQLCSFSVRQEVTASVTPSARASLAVHYGTATSTSAQRF